LLGTGAELFAEGSRELELSARERRQGERADERRLRIDPERSGKLERASVHLGDPIGQVSLNRHERGRELRQ
jgi:hypothetical protein